MKKTIFCILGVVIVAVCIWTIGTGLREESTVYVDDYSLNEDNSTITLHVGVGSSIGFVRKAVTNQNEDGEIMLKFLSAFGGVNGSIAAQDTYDIPLDEYSTSISIDQGDHDRIILEKKLESGEWLPVDWIVHEGMKKELRSTSVE